MLKKILKNSSYLLVAQVFTKGLAFFYTLFLARSLGVSGYGLYVAALSYFSLVSIIVDFGIGQYLIREVSVKREKLSLLLSHAIILRAVILSVTFMVFAIFMTIFDKDSMRSSIMLFAILACLPQAIALSFDSAFIALQKLSYSAVSLIILSVSTTAVGVYLILNGFGVMGAVIALLTAQFIYLLVNIGFGRKLKTGFDLNITYRMLKVIITESLPYGILGMLGLLYFKVDALLLNYMRGSFDTGIYGAAYKFLEAIVFVPTSISVALFPVLSNLAVTSPKNIYRLYLKVTGVLLLLSLLVVAIYILVLPMIIQSVLPQFIPSIPVVRILTLTIPLLFMISPQGIVLLSQKRFLKPLIIISVFNMLLNLILNIIFIPHFSYFASAWITVLSDLVGFLIFFLYIRAQFITD